jgi:enoyl-CoA hydratase/carnithine racemase
MSTNLRIETRDGGVAVLFLDVAGQPVNTITPELLEELERETAPLFDDPSVRALVVASGKPDGFVAGADLKRIAQMSAEEVERLSRRGQALLRRVAESPKPVVAAVHGAALGGGLELVLACRYVVASDDPETVLALPEVMLGLLPAGGGTQRLPRRIGLPDALPMLLTGKRIRARKALQLGLVDAITTPVASLRRRSAPPGCSPPASSSAVRCRWRSAPSSSPRSACSPCAPRASRSGSARAASIPHRSPFSTACRPVCCAASIGAWRPRASPSAAWPPGPKRGPSSASSSP